MSYLMELFGSISLSTAITFIAAVAFIVVVIKKCYCGIVKFHDIIQERLDMLDEIAVSLKKLQTEQIQLKESIDELKKAQMILGEKQTKFEEQHRHHSLSKIRERLLYNYRYFTDIKKNPEKAWSEMEKEAFDSLFHDYEELGGNGFMHSVVEPAMLSLEVVAMDNQDRLVEVMRNRMG